MIEEAYNQDDRVVQHIFNGYYLSTTKDMMYTFTQEWPMGGQAHQISYSIAYQALNGRSNGLGDALVNYRYQLWNEKDWCWIARQIRGIDGHTPAVGAARGFLLNFSQNRRRGVFRADIQALTRKLENNQAP